MWGRCLISITVLMFALPSISATAEVTIDAGRSFDCQIEPRVVVKVAAEVSGVLKSVLVERGDVVSAGQVVAIFQSDVQEAIVALARLKAGNHAQIRAQQSRRDVMRRKVERVQALQRKEFASTSALDEVKSELTVIESAEEEAQLMQELARLELDREERILAQRKIRSPVSGVVTEKMLSAGEYRNENNHIVTVAQIDPLNVEVFVPIALIDRIRIGGRAKVMPEGASGNRLDASVVIVDRVADAASGTFGVRLTLPNSEHRLPAGLRCKIEFAD